MSIMSDEVNYLVYRYLQESGYHHSAYTFGLESHITQSNVNGSLVPPGALINILQKGIQFIEGELCINDDGSLVDNLDTLGGIPLIDAVIPEALAERAATIYRLVSQKTEITKSLLSPNTTNHVQQNQNNEGMTLLHGHKSEVFSCCWHPSSRFVATGAADGIVGLWQLDISEIKILELSHNRIENNIKHSSSTDITSLTWHPEGHFLTTTSAIEHTIKVWDKTGSLVASLVGHKELILTLNWNKAGTLLLSAGLDKKCIIWQPESWQKLQEIECHTGPVVDADWQNNEIFASCSTDRTICVCKADGSEVLKTWSGHTEVINCIKWDPDGNVLASCSDDKLIKLWSLKDDKCICDLSGHTKEITLLKWSSKKMLASASYDTTVRIWDTEACACLYNFTQHMDPVNSISFHPSGSYLVSGSLDGVLNIWNLQNGSCVLSKRSPAGVFEAQWSPNGYFICICMADKICDYAFTLSTLSNDNRASVTFSRKKGTSQDVDVKNQVKIMDVRKLPES